VPTHILLGGLWSKSPSSTNYLTAPLTCFYSMKSKNMTPLHTVAVSNAGYLCTFGVKLLTIIIRYALILVSTSSPDSRYSFLRKKSTTLRLTKAHVSNAGYLLNLKNTLLRKSVFQVCAFVPRTGLEPACC